MRNSFQWGKKNALILFLRTACPRWGKGVGGEHQSHFCAQKPQRKLERGLGLEPVCLHRVKREEAGSLATRESGGRAGASGCSPETLENGEERSDSSNTSGMPPMGARHLEPPWRVTSLSACGGRGRRLSGAQLISLLGHKGV